MLQVKCRRRPSQGRKNIVVYHNHIDDPTDDQPHHQKLEQKHRMIWRSEDGAPVQQVEQVGATMNAMHVAGSLPEWKWKSEFTCVLWVCRWTAVGLGPVRPIIVLSKPLGIPVGKVLLLSASQRMKRTNREV